jgi:hypothetical protein
VGEPPRTRAAAAGGPVVNPALDTARRCVCRIRYLRGSQSGTRRIGRTREIRIDDLSGSESGTRRFQGVECRIEHPGERPARATEAAPRGAVLPPPDVATRGAPPPGTAAEVTPIRSVDRLTIGSGRAGEMTLMLQKRFLDNAQGRAPDEHGWLTHVRPGAAVLSHIRGWGVAGGPGQVVNAALGTPRRPVFRIRCLCGSQHDTRRFGRHDEIRTDYLSGSQHGKRRSQVARVPC